MTHDHDDNGWMERSANAFLRFVAWTAILCVIALVVIALTGAEGAQVSEEVRLAKGRIIVDALYPDSGFRPWVGTLIAEHERYGDEGFAAAWFHSLTYGAANFGLKVGATAPGNCAGPMDVKHFPLILEPGANLRYHVAEMWVGWGKGYRGRGLCEYVMLPSRPHDWGNGMFRRTDATHRDVIAEAWRLGTLKKKLVG